MFSISPIFVKFGLDHSNTPLVGLAIGIAVTVPCMHLATRVLTGDWVRVQRSMTGWLVFGGVSAGFAIIAPGPLCRRRQYRPGRFGETRQSGSRQLSA